MQKTGVLKGATNTRICENEVRLRGEVISCIEQSGADYAIIIRTITPHDGALIIANHIVKVPKASKLLPALQETKTGDYVSIKGALRGTFGSSVVFPVFFYNETPRVGGASGRKWYENEVRLRGKVVQELSPMNNDEFYSFEVETRQSIKAGKVRVEIHSVKISINHPAFEELKYLALGDYVDVNGLMGLDRRVIVNTIVNLTQSFSDNGNGRAAASAGRA